MLLKALFLTVLGISQHVSVFAQNSGENKKENQDIHDFIIVRLSISHPAASPRRISAHIGAVQVVDARPDTMAIGFMQKHSRNRIFLSLKNGVRTETEKFIRAYLGLENNEAGATLVIVIKKLWLTDELETRDSNFKDTLTKWTSGILAKIEFYVKRNEDYYPLYRYDTVLRKALTIAEYGPGFIEWALTSSVAKLIRMDSGAIAAGGRKLSWQEIADYNDQKYRIPILLDSVLNRGVYLSYEEFKQNNPSQKNFEIRKDKYSDVLYLKQPDGKETVERNVWGYCDGENIFVKSAENYFRLQRRANAFYTYGVKNLDRIGTTYGNGYFPNTPDLSNGYYAPSAVGALAGSAVYDQFKKPKFRLALKPFQLDWDSGKLY